MKALTYPKQMDNVGYEQAAADSAGHSIATPLRVLILEDNPRDVELCIQELNKAGFELQVDAVDTQEGFAAKLQSRVYDLILADNSIPDWTGVEAFHLLKRSGKNIPFIFVSGTMGEEAAVDLIKEGVTDYILKDRLVRLPSAVHRALEGKNTLAERERATRALQESEERVRLLLDSTAEAICGVDLEDICTFTNPACVRMLGYQNPEDLLGKQMHLLTHHTRTEGTPYPPEECPIYKAFNEGKGVHVDDEVFWRRDGTSFPVEYWSHPMLRDGKPAGAVVTFLDISERKRADRTLRKERDRAQQYLDIADVILLALDLEGKITRVNRKGCSTLGWQEHELLGRNWIDTCLPARTRDAHRTSFDNLAGGDQAYVENPILTKSGEERMIGWRNTLLRDGAARIIGTLSSGEDITERKRAEEALRGSEARARCLVESNIIGISTGDLDGKLIDANDAFLGLLGFTRKDLLSGELPWDALTPPEYRDADRLAIERLKSTGSASPWEKQFFRKDGSRVSVLIGVTTLMAARGELEAVSFVVDISERKQLEGQLRMAQKMEAVGQLAGGIAHDFNNLLGVIIGWSEVLEERLEQNDPLRPKAEQIKKAGQRAATLTRQLLAFSRKQVLEPRVLDLNAVVADTLKMLQRLIGENIQLVTIQGPELGRVKADQGQIEQVIVNLAINARDAISQAGKLTISIANAEMDDISIRQHPGAVPGSYVMLALSDTGCGMDRETQAHIFEPFFTTKESGRGTGLGLSTVYGIVKQSGGYIAVYSELGLGTTFKIYLPRVEQSAAQESSSKDIKEVLRGWETILLVEDAPPLRELAGELLEASGYKVLEAASGAEAIQVAGRYGKPIHLLLTDVVMPGMDGSKLAECMGQSYPGIKVLYMSGYTDDAIVHHGVLDSGVTLLQKPFTRESLTRKVREVLGPVDEHLIS